uniref:Uncharacterized protein n=1 Tax=Arundo donax TaxID=35708 RepID=A0A0A9FU64_ARUDO
MFFCHANKVHSSSSSVTRDYKISLTVSILFSVLCFCSKIGSFPTF